MSIDSSTQTTALYQALQTAALDAYGSLLSPDLATKAATAFADEANGMLETLLVEHTHALKDRIEAQLSGMSLAKGAKRKAIKTPAAPTNGAVPADANGASTNGATNGAAAHAVKAAPAPAEKPAKTESKTPARSKARGRKRGRARA